MDIEQILKIMDRFDNSNMTSFCLEEEDFSLTLESKKKVVVEGTVGNIVPATSVLPVHNQAQEDQKATSNEGTDIKSPLVGTFYAAKEEGEKPFVSVGDRVVKGQTIGIIEAMKLMNEVEAEVDGVVAEIYVENEQLVEYGQTLIRVV